MNVLVVGCGRLGSQIAAIMDSMGHDVAVVDEHPELFYRLPTDFSGMTVTGMPMDLKVLKSAGVENCDMAAVVTPDDNLNITVTQIIQQFFKVENVVTRISDPAREEVFTAFGLQTVCPTNLAGDMIVQALLNPNQSKQVAFGTANAAFHTYPAESFMIGKRLGSIGVNEKEVPFALLQKDGTMILVGKDPDYLIQREDRMIWTQVID